MKRKTVWSRVFEPGNHIYNDMTVYVEYFYLSEKAPNPSKAAMNTRDIFIVRP